MGILDISGDHRSRHPHTLGLVTTATQMIENSMVLSACQHQILVQLHPRAEGIGSIAQGVLAFSEDGCLVGANRRGLALLKLRFADVASISWSHLFEQNFEALLSNQLRLAGQSEPIICRDGTRLFVQMHSQSRVRHSMTLRSGSAPQTISRPTQSVQPEVDGRWQAALEKASKVIDKGIPLLVTGESGVGKEVFAQTVHRNSQRRDQGFVAVNCAAIPEHLIEAELFGYVAGAFTGASRQGAAGRLREADGGTLFLDEIGDMPLGLQTRLLRVLQERQVTPLGSSQAIAVDVNLICATHQNLRQNILQGRFREDLFYRINGLSLSLPALRERSDFSALCAQMLQEFAAHPVWLESDVLAALQSYRWPGNLRQLSHVLRTAVALMDEGQGNIGWEQLGDELVDDMPRHASLATIATITPSADRKSSSGLALLESQGTDALALAAPVQNLQENARQLIQQALAQANGNVSAAARHLGISRQTLYRKLQEQS